MAAQSRCLMVDPDRGESANWILPDLAPMNDRIREILCDATKKRAAPASGFCVSEGGVSKRPLRPAEPLLRPHAANDWREPITTHRQKRLDGINPSQLHHSTQKRGTSVQSGTQL